MPASAMVTRPAAFWDPESNWKADKTPPHTSLGTLLSLSTPPFSPHPTFCERWRAVTKIATRLS